MPVPPFTTFGVLIRDHDNGRSNETVSTIAKLKVMYFPKFLALVRGAMTQGRVPQNNQIGIVLRFLAGQVNGLGTAVLTVDYAGLETNSL